ncbi:uncharacterized protein N7469_004593 [Penicillium citrinum]|uniref:Uncharacterized protein n=1 Tax=Penicillium citrinum TaxID=5077 RepID=A0A9W9P5C0_PENCI|nr:uncharacterized protein N7469_004593 [Penicillium citrinum]KAJ5235425.1 hypothetical protein N7469_004593 [Penicillium citrinum]
MAVALLRDNPLQDVDRARRNEYHYVRTSIGYTAKNTALTGHEKSHGCISSVSAESKKAGHQSRQVASCQTNK